MQSQIGTRTCEEDREGGDLRRSMPGAPEYQLQGPWPVGPAGATSANSDNHGPTGQKLSVAGKRRKLCAGHLVDAALEDPDDIHADVA